MKCLGCGKHLAGGKVKAVVEGQIITQMGKFRAEEVLGGICDDCCDSLEIAQGNPLLNLPS